MTRSLSLVMLSFEFFGCATLSDTPETPIAANPETQISGARSDDVPSHTVIKLDNGRDNDRKEPLAVTLSTDEIRQLQTLLKTVGFNPGRVDGAFGPKTRIALIRLRSSCSALNDLLQGVALERIAPSIDSPASDRIRAAGMALRKEEIQVVQVRLKDAGFDPGTVDGIAGPNTRTAIARFRSGCSTLNATPPAIFEMAGSARQGDMSSATVARNGMTNDAARAGGAER